MGRGKSANRVLQSRGQRFFAQTGNFKEAANFFNKKPKGHRQQINKIIKSKDTVKDKIETLLSIANMGNRFLLDSKLDPYILSNHLASLALYKSASYNLLMETTEELPEENKLKLANNILLFEIQQLFLRLKESETTIPPVHLVDNPRKGRSLYVYFMIALARFAESRQERQTNNLTKMEKSLLEIKSYIKKVPLN